VVHSIRWIGSKRLWRQIMAAKKPAGGLGSVKVFSVHHQAAEKLGRGLKVVATSMDGKIVEALVHKRFPKVLAVQFHPEHRNIWSPSTKAQPSIDHPIRNVASSTLADDKRSRAFHVGIWRVFARWLHAEHRRQRAPARRRITAPN